MLPAEERLVKDQIQVKEQQKLVLALSLEQAVLQGQVRQPDLEREWELVLGQTPALERVTELEPELELVWVVDRAPELAWVVA